MLTRSAPRPLGSLRSARLPLPLHRSLSLSSSRLSPPPPSPPAQLLLSDLRTLLGRYPLLDPAWNSRLERAQADLAHPRAARVAVVGGTESGAHDLVTAILDDPLSSNPEVTVALEARRLRSDAPEAIVIKYGHEGKASASEVELPAGWLKEHKAEVVEVVHGEGVPPLESSFSTLHVSDAVVLVLSDSSLLSSKSAQTLLYNLESKPNLFLALNAPDASPAASSSPLRTLQHQLATSFPTTSSSPSPPKTVVISTSQAISALEALNPSTPGQQPDYTAFQRLYLSSQIPALSSQLSSNLSTHSSSSTVPTPLQLQTASSVLLSALHRAAFSGAQIADSLSSAQSALSALSEHASEQSRALLASLGVDSATGLLKVPSDELAAALSAIEHTLLTRLAWYKLPYRVDDLHAELALVVSSTYLPAFEDSLVYAAGRAVALSSLLSTRVDTLLASPLFAHSPFSAALSPAQRLASLHSPMLLNRVAQAEVEARTGQSSTALSAAVTHRRNQITAPGGPTDALQRRAQTAVVQSTLLSLSSLVGATASQVVEYAELATNVGWGVLGVTTAAWWLQSRWERAKRRFRKDVGERIVGGLEEDLGVAARRLSDRALFKTRTAVALAEELVRKRQQEFESFRAELARIEARRKEVEEEGK